MKRKNTTPQTSMEAPHIQTTLYETPSSFVIVDKVVGFFRNATFSSIDQKSHMYLGPEGFCDFSALGNKYKTPDDGKSR